MQEPVIIKEERTLLHLISQGDQTAFTTLYDAYKDKIYTIGIRLTGSTSLAEEIVQDIFLKIWLKRETLATVDHFRAYLFTATRNHIFNVLKRIARHRSITAELAHESPATASDTDDLLLDKEYQQLLQAAIGQLPPQQKLVYQLIRVQGLKREEVAAQLQLSPQTVKQHLAQAMRSIRAYCVTRLDLYITILLFETLHK